MKPALVWLKDTFCCFYLSFLENKITTEDLIVVDSDDNMLFIYEFEQYMHKLLAMKDVQDSGILELLHGRWNYDVQLS